MAADLCCHNAVSRTVSQEARKIATRKAKLMKFASIRLVASDIRKMVAFYELVTGYRADWLAPVFAEIVMPDAALAIGSVETLAPCSRRAAQSPAPTEQALSSSWFPMSMRNTSD